MNWHIFNLFGYLGVGLWGIVPLLWLVYWRWQQAWLRYLAATLTLAAFVCAKVNSATHVNRIETIPTSVLTQRASREEEIRKAALEGRSSEVAQIAFAEDASGEFLDKAGMDEADLKYLGGEPSATPEWKRQKQGRAQEAANDASPEDKLSSEISGPDTSKGMDAGIVGESAKRPPITMSEADVAKAHRLDRWNLGITRFLILAAVLLLAADYLRRANHYARASLPLRLPSVWLNSFTPMPPVVIRPQPPRRAIPAELEWLTRRGDPFVYLTDNPADADAVVAHLTSLPKRRRPQVLRVTDGISDEFVFESLWFGRGSFVVDSAARAKRMLEHFNGCLEQRRTTRARVAQTAHIVWDVSSPIPETTRESLVKLAHATGFSVFACHDSQAAK
jgi:hypothetical protein